jgi:hypothetical protein
MSLPVLPTPPLHHLATWPKTPSRHPGNRAPHAPHHTGSVHTSHARLTPTHTPAFPLRESRAPHRSNSAALPNTPVVAATYGCRLARALCQLLVAPWPAHAVAETAFGGACAGREHRVQKPRREAVGVAAVAAGGAPGPEDSFVGGPAGGLCGRRGIVGGIWDGRLV